MTTDLQRLAGNKEHFLKRVEKHPSGCWFWIGHITEKGYGRYLVNGKHYFAHRYSYILFVKQPSDLVCHKCDVRRCVNPEHLYEGDYAANNRDTLVRGRLAYGKCNGVHTHPEKLRYGASNPASKLNPQKAMEIFDNRGIIPQKKLAKKYGVAESIVWSIQKGRTWAEEIKKFRIAAAIERLKESL